MKKTLLSLILSVPFMINASPYNSGYAAVTEVKIWPDYIDIYLDTNNACPKEGHETRYVLAKEQQEMYSTLFAAMMAQLATSIKYTCRDDGVAEIYGIRVKPKA